MATDDPPNEVKTARTTFRIIDELSDRTEATLTELTEAFDLSKSSVHNYLATLERDGYVVREDDRYRVGLRFLEYGGQARHHNRLYRIARDEVATLAEETGELANLLAEEHGKGIYVYRSKGEQAVQTDSYTGHRVHLHSTALGKAVLAHLPDERVDEIVDRHGLPPATENTITDRDELHAELERVRERGVAFDDEARLEGLRCVAVPITDDEDDVKGAVSLSGPVSRFQGQYFRSELPERLRDAANIIEL
ncbi:MAG: IclR family transcriptional regulator, partial [Halorientalis sp.]